MAETGGGTARFTWDVTQQAPQVIDDGTTSYIYGPGGLPIEQVPRNGEVNYFFHDANGNTRALLTGTGTVAASFSYGAYGELTKETGTARTPLLYGQGYTDTQTGLLYLVNRYYDATSGQFLSLDPAVAETEAPYSYAGSDPVNSDDPSGLCFWSCVLDVAESAVDTVKHGVGTAVGVAVTAYTCVTGSRQDCGESVLGSALSYGAGLLYWPVGVVVGILWDDEGHAGETNFHVPSNARAPARASATPARGEPAARC